MAAAALSAPSIKERIDAARGRDRGAERVFEIGAERRERVLPQRHARRHGVAAALDQQTFAHRLAHRAAEIDAGDRAARAGADAARLERDREGRTAEPLLEPRGDQADHARMPAFGGGDDHRALLLEAERRHRLGLGLRQRRHLDRLALAIEPVELGGEPRAFDRILLQQQIDAERGAADAAAGIDARPEQEAEMPGLRRAAQARDVHQRGQSDILAPAQRQQALGDEGAVETLERHHVGDGAERDQIEQAEQIGLRPRRRSRSRARAARG